MQLWSSIVAEDVELINSTVYMVCHPDRMAGFKWEKLARVLGGYFLCVLCVFTLLGLRALYLQHFKEED